MLVQEDDWEEIIDAEGGWGETVDVEDAWGDKRCRVCLGETMISGDKGRDADDA